MKVMRSIARSDDSSALVQQCVINPADGSLICLCKSVDGVVHGISFLERTDHFCKTSSVLGDVVRITVTSNATSPTKDPDIHSLVRHGPFTWSVRSGPLVNLKYHAGWRSQIEASQCYLSARPHSHFSSSLLSRPPGCVMGLFC